DTDKPMAAATHAAALVMDLDIVPMIERIADLARGNRIGLFQVFQGCIGKDHAPAERVIRAVALHNRHIVSRIGKLHQQTEIQAGRPSSYAHDFHGLAPGTWLIFTLSLNYIVKKIGAQEILLAAKTNVLFSDKGGSPGPAAQVC